MSHPSRLARRRPRPGVEPLEARALLANAGSLDPGFGGGYGYSTAPTGLPVASFPHPTYFLGYQASADSVNALPDGNVLVTGTISYVVGSVSSVSAALSVDELNADGSLDTSFGKGGQVQIPIAYSQLTTPTIQAFQVAVDPAGRIILASNATDGGGNATYLVARLTASGAFDPTFGTGGVAEYPASTTTPIADRIDKIAAVLPQSNDQVIVAGNSATGFSAVRLNADGSLDATFGTNGTATVAIPGSQVGNLVASGAAMQANGQVVVTGNFTNRPVTSTSPVFVEIAVIRLNADGSQDASFGGPSTGHPGIDLIPPSNPSPLYAPPTVTVQPTTGKILVAGNNRLQQYGNFVPALHRLNTDGTLDTSFGTGGMLTPNLPGANPLYGIDMAVQADGSIVLTGSVYYANVASGFDIYKLEVLRLAPDGTPDATFGNTSTPGVLQTNLNCSDGLPQAPAIRPTNGDILLVGTGTVPSPSGLTYGFTVDSVLPSAPTGPAATPHPPLPPADFSGLGYSNPAIYDPTSSRSLPMSGSFIYYPSNQAGLADVTGLNGIGNIDSAYGPSGVGQSIPAAADYLGLGFDQLAVYLPSTGVYAIQATSNSPAVALPLGPAGAGQSIPVPADYYRTGQADIAVYITQTGTFAIKDPSGKTTGFTVAFGIPGAGQSIPAPADYFEQGQADLAVYLTRAGEFAIRNPATNQDVFVPFGKPGVGNSIPVPGDYTGSGAIDLAVYIPSAGVYIYRTSANAPKDVIVPIGTPNSGEVAAPGDYDGSGRTEAAIYDPKGGFIEYQPADGGPVVKIQVGTASNGTIPVTAPSGSLPEYLPPPPPGSAIRGGAIVPPPAASGTSGSAGAITVSRASAVPAGPTPASIRVPRTLVNQASPTSMEKPS